MKRYLAVLIIISTACGCGRNRPRYENPGKIIADSAKQHIMNSPRTDSESKLYAKLWSEAVGEPQIDTYRREVYQYAHGVFLGPIFLFRIEETADSGYLIMSKVIVEPRHATNLHYDQSLLRRIAFIPKTKFADSISLIIYSIDQRIDEKDWQQFRQIVQGCFYWTFTDPMPNDGLLDGDNLGLTSMSVWPHNASQGQLLFHKNTVHCPFGGSYADGFNYLAKKSILVKKLGITPDVIIR